MNYEYDEAVLKCFLKQQKKLFSEPVASSMEEAEGFLEDCMAVVVDSVGDVLEYFEEAGTWKTRTECWKRRKYLKWETGAI